MGNRKFTCHWQKMFTKRKSYRGESRTAATSKMKRFVIIVNGSFDIGAVLDPPLSQSYFEKRTLDLQYLKNKQSLFILNISFFWSCQDRYFFSRTLDLQYLRNNSHFLFLIVISSGHARIDSFSSNYHSTNYSTILLNFNVSRLFHHSFCFKSSISDSPVFYVLNSHP